MPGGYKNITGAEGNKFSSTNQPKSNGRKPTKILTALLNRQLQAKKDITVQGIDVVTGKKTTVKIPMPTKDIIIGALLREAAKGNMNAIREVFDRMEGKAVQPMETTGGETILVTRIRSTNEPEKKPKQ